MYHHIRPRDGSSLRPASTAGKHVTKRYNPRMPRTKIGRTMMDQLKLSRRAVLAGTAAAGAVGFAASPANAQVNWKKYAGTKLEAILAKGPRGDNFQKYIKEFTDLTGIQVESEQIPEQQQRQKCVIELASGKPSFDVVHLSYHVQKRQFEKAGWLANITPFMKDQTLTAPDLVESDFSAAGLPTPRTIRGRCSRCRGRSTTSSSITTRTSSRRRACSRRRRSTR